MMKLHEKLKDYRLILASQSPRRRELLKGLGLSFEVKTFPGGDESYPFSLKKEKIALFLARKKASYFMEKEKLDEKDIVITADTIVWINGKELGKPAGKKEAVEMLTMLSGQRHTVYTGVCLTSAVKQDAFFSETHVFFRHLSPEEINFYVETFAPYDKAGAYGAQEWIGYIAIERIEGSYFNVMGLPVDKLWNALEKFIH